MIGNQWGKASWSSSIWGGELVALKGPLSDSSIQKRSSADLSNRGGEEERAKTASMREVEDQKNNRRRKGGDKNLAN